MLHARAFARQRGPGRMGTAVPWYMGPPTHHLPARSCVKSGDEDKLIAIMRESAPHYDGVPELMNEYLKKIETLK